MKHFIAKTASLVALLDPMPVRTEPVRTPVPDARPVLLAALQADSGKAHGVLTGETANAITRHFGASSPIYIDVSTEKKYQQPGCSRLKVLFWQEGVLLPEAKEPRRQTIEFGIDYCMDGLPPRSLS
ncbi:hypothetical protein [Pseudorhodoferax soli]|uniref:Uncharacterized protein n=1 Tax=Pseudorhodoferax soli TaxID=545864 RepID=A0A368XAT9_9BURK|nr:hypothetical protein [Pseudorhodoferax soli]RCW65083.1 hypothetical protein DES41_1137 [Pseudorhodoferax soli]